MPRISWHELPAATRATAAAHTGTVRAARNASAGINSGIAALLDTDHGPFFVKGVPVDHPQARTQQREAEINPHLPDGCPRLLWRIRTPEWDLLGFERLTGRTADFTPGSKDLPKVVAALDRLARTPCPALPLKQVQQRWAPYTDPASLHQLDGEHLLHTDVAPHNLIVDDDAAHLIDWAWPTRGPAWVDAGVWALRLLEAGHTPASAHQWASCLPGAPLQSPPSPPSRTPTPRSGPNSLSRTPPAPGKPALPPTPACGRISSTGALELSTNDPKREGLQCITPRLVPCSSNRKTPCLDP
jgi:hypothetical protein